MNLRRPRFFLRTTPWAQWQETSGQWTICDSAETEAFRRMATFEKSEQVGCRTWSRTSISRSKIGCPTIRRPGKSAVCVRDDLIGNDQIQRTAIRAPKLMPIAVDKWFSRWSWQRQIYDNSRLSTSWRKSPKADYRFAVGISRSLANVTAHSTSSSGMSHR